MRTKKAPSRSKCHLWSQNFTGELTYSCCTACNLQTYARKNLQGTIYTYKAYFGQHYNTKTNNENKSEKIPINAHKGANKKLSSSLPFFRQIWSHFSPKIWKPYPMGKETQAGFSVRRNNLKRKPILSRSLGADLLFPYILFKNTWPEPIEKYREYT